MTDAIRMNLIAQLQWSDPNGIYSDHDCEAEGFPIWTLADAVQMVRRMADEEAIGLWEICRALKLSPEATSAVINGQD